MTDKDEPGRAVVSHDNDPPEPSHPDDKFGSNRDTEVPRSNWTDTWTTTDLRTWQLSDPELAVVIEYKRRCQKPEHDELMALDRRTRTLLARWDQLTLQGDVLYLTTRDDCDGSDITVLVTPHFCVRTCSSAPCMKVCVNLRFVWPLPCPFLPSWMKRVTERRTSRWRINPADQEGRIPGHH